MTRTADIQTTVDATAVFERVFGAKPDIVARAPARANLLGEHTDYNDGFVLPTPLRFTTSVAVGRNGTPGSVDAFAEAFGERKLRQADSNAQGDWLDYVIGCLREIRDQGVELPGLRIAIAGDVPMGAGISSSAALEVATLRALRGLLGLKLDDVTIAKLGQRAEGGYVGMPCGIMDQMVASLGTPGQALFLDTRDLSRALVPLPAGHRVAIIHCGVAHRLVDGGYKQRRRECEEAAARLGVPMLRDASLADLPRIAALPDPLSRRARHVVTENQRVLDGVEALRRGDVATFGRLMVESHESQRDDYNVSIEEIDRLQQSAMRHGATGARLTGGGFGGSIVALVPDSQVEAWWKAVSAENPQARPITL